MNDQPVYEPSWVRQQTNRPVRTMVTGLLVLGAAFAALTGSMFLWAGGAGPPAVPRTGVRAMRVTYYPPTMRQHGPFAVRHLLTTNRRQIEMIAWLIDIRPVQGTAAAIVCLGNINLPVDTVRFETVRGKVVTAMVDDCGSIHTARDAMLDLHHTVERALGRIVAMAARGTGRSAVTCGGPGQRSCTTVLGRWPWLCRPKIFIDGTARRIDRGQCEGTLARFPSYNAALKGDASGQSEVIVVKGVGLRLDVNNVTANNGDDLLHLSGTRPHVSLVDNRGITGVGGTYVLSFGCPPRAGCGGG